MTSKRAEVLAKNSEMSRDEWLIERRKGIGGSDASIILGLNKWKTPFELWLDKTGQVPVSESQSEAAYFGSLLEDIVAKEFEIRSGKKVRRKKAILRHPEYNFILANVDRMIVGEKAILECKTTSAYNLKEWEDEEIPESYIVQVQHYLGVLGPEYRKASLLQSYVLNGLRSALPMNILILYITYSNFILQPLLLLIRHSMNVQVMR